MASQPRYDIIGDVHGCYDELCELVALLGYGDQGHPDGRILVQVGDLVDRGPKSFEVLRWAMEAVRGGWLIQVLGNHEVKLMKKLEGRNVKLTHGLEVTWAQFETYADEGFRAEALEFLRSLEPLRFLDGGLVVAHAGSNDQLINRPGKRRDMFATFGDVDGTVGSDGYPDRKNWALGYSGKVPVVYGHVPVDRLEWVNNTLNLDTGCVYGNTLTALRWPEREVVNVRARRAYAEHPIGLMNPTLPFADQRLV